ncbi:hypothetical protein HZH66_010985 [Vespula vulgaris]|uniref:Uncharacterized protein n=1 Tax=Vespula vulgaris TaxID=7454 RepID=A0A834MZ22_VESVU|nr:hypothetical protein HZH66_010985 [Vespula vulgaris]
MLRQFETAKSFEESCHTASLHGSSSPFVFLLVARLFAKSTLLARSYDIADWWKYRKTGCCVATLKSSSSFVQGEGNELEVGPRLFSIGVLSVLSRRSLGRRNLDPVPVEDTEETTRRRVLQRETTPLISTSSDHSWPASTDVATMAGRSDEERASSSARDKQDCIRGICIRAGSSST